MSLGGTVLSVLSGLFSRNALSTVSRIVGRIITLLVLLFRKKVFLAFAVYWTFSNTIKNVVFALNGGRTLTQVGTIFVEEASVKFLGAAPQIQNGLTSLNQGNIIQGITSLWTGIAAVYMLIFLYSLFWSKGGNRRVHWQEKLLILAVWILLSAQIHSTELIIDIVNQTRNMSEGLTSSLPSQNLEANNTSYNLSTG